jgi:uncharacterized protein with HEPN domain
MVSSRPKQRILDIVANIERIEAFTSQLSRAEYEADLRTVLAVERCLLIISEAAVKLGSEAESLMPKMPWEDIRGIGNQLRHGYDRLDADTLWSTIERDLQPLHAACLQAIKTTKF